jgi:hypothetical protein
MLFLFKEQFGSSLENAMVTTSADLHADRAHALNISIRRMS